MAIREINLISNRHQLTSAEIRIRGLIQLWTPLILGGYVLVLLLIIGYGIFLKSSLASVEKSIVVAKENISAREQDEGLYLLLKQKVGVLTQIFANRADYTSLYNYFNDLQSENLAIQALTIRENGTAVLEVAAADAYALDGYVKKILESAESRFQSVELVTIQYKKEDVYSVTLDITQKTKKIVSP